MTIHTAESISYTSYIPSDGTPYLPFGSREGLAFEEKFCSRCILQPVSPESESRCSHLVRAFCGEENGKWVWRKGKPICTAFRDRQRQERKQRRMLSPNQLSLF